MAVKIKLKRLGKIHAPFYRIIVADARNKRDGRAIEEIGKYDPKTEPSVIQVDSDRAQHWLSVGAQPTDPVRKLLEITGDWQKFKGLPGAEGTLKSGGPKADKKEIFAAAVAETLTAGEGTKSKARRSAGKAADGDEAGGEAGAAKSGASGAKAGSRTGTRQPRASKPKADGGKDDTAASAKADTAKADTAKADTAKADTAKADTAKADDAKAETAPADSAPVGDASAADGTPEAATADATEQGSGA